MVARPTKRSVTPKLGRVNVRVPPTRSQAVAAAQGQAFLELLAALSSGEQADQTGVSPSNGPHDPAAGRGANRSCDRPI